MEETKKQDVDEFEDTLTLGGKPEEATVSVRFFGDYLIPDELTKLLNCEPTEAYQKGQKVTTKFSTRTTETGQWFLSVEKNSNQTLEEQILEIFEKLTKDLEIWKELSERFESSIYCGTWLKGWNRDVWFSADLFREIADRKLELGLAIYCDEDEK